MTLVLAPMCMSACGRMVKMFSWRLMVLLNMEFQLLGRSSWLGFYIIFHQFWHLQLQFRTGEYPVLGCAIYWPVDYLQFYSKYLFPSLPIMHSFG